jgi:ArsR family transcriptional regulator, arsenate/arsenite/antimonite-responsive transcriptional repressor
VISPSSAEILLNSALVTPLRTDHKFPDVGNFRGQFSPQRGRESPQKAGLVVRALQLLDYFDKSSNIENVEHDDVHVQKFADRFAAIGSEPRLRIVRLLLSAYPDGMIVGELQQELGIANSTLSHHLEKLKHETLVSVSREGTALRYRANADAFRELLDFLMAECCTRNRVIDPPKPCC